MRAVPTAGRLRTGHITGSLEDIPQYQPRVWQLHWGARPRGTTLTVVCLQGILGEVGVHHKKGAHCGIKESRQQALSTNQIFQLVGSFFQQRHSCSSGLSRSAAPTQQTALVFVKDVGEREVFPPHPSLQAHLGLFPWERGIGTTIDSLPGTCQGDCICKGSQFLSTWNLNIATDEKKCVSDSNSYITGTEVCLGHG